jgi:hypothetical protein
MAPVGCEMRPDRRESKLDERVKRSKAQQRLLPPAAMTHERKMENTNASRKTQYKAE